MYAAESRRRPVLLGYSEHVIPHPADWPEVFHTTGYWFLEDEAGWEPPRELVEFLEADEPPVCVGFGSMTGRDPAALTRLVVEAVERAGRRAISPCCAPRSWSAGSPFRKARCPRLSARWRGW